MLKLFGNYRQQLKKQWMLIIQVRVIITHRPSQNPSDDIAGAGIGWQLPVGNSKPNGPDMVGYYPKGNAFFITPSSVFFIYNSLLSEFGVLGFEYGYSLASPDHLILWEAQFGDFANGAQVIIDQFISTAQSKWNRMSGLVMLLPHGYDGQGPEHSSARLERYLQSCAEMNMVIANASTPANFFHLLRRQLHWDFRKPLIVMSPKSLLRHTDCISDVAEFQTGTHFKEVLDDKYTNLKDKNQKLLFCSGQFYYDLHKRRMESERKDLAIIRIEQLYPFPEKQIEAILQKYNPAEVIWCQEEPLNMGAATYMSLQWKWGNLKICGRSASAASAVGHKKIHDQQLSDLLKNIFEA